MTTQQNIHVIEESLNGQAENQVPWCSTDLRACNEQEIKVRQIVSYWEKSQPASL